MLVPYSRWIAESVSVAVERDVLPCFITQNGRAVGNATNRHQFVKVDRRASSQALIIQQSAKSDCGDGVDVPFPQFSENFDAIPCVKVDAETRCECADMILCSRRRIRHCPIRPARIAD